MNEKWQRSARSLRLFGWGSVASLALLLSGCAPEEEEVLDVETPGVSVEINDTEDGANVEVERNDE